MTAMRTSTVIPMKHTLHIRLRPGEGAVLRTLGMVERRGFLLDSMSVGEATAEDRPMAITVTSDRPVELLGRQLERLHDVLAVEVGAAAKRWAGHTAAART